MDQEEDYIWRDYTIIRVICIFDIIVSILGTVGVIAFITFIQSSFGWILMMVFIVLMYLLQFFMAVKLLIVHRVCQDRIKEYKKFTIKWLIGSFILFLFCLIKFGFVIFNSGPNILWLLFGAEIILRIMGIYFNVEFLDDLKLYKPKKSSSSPSPKPCTSKDIDDT